MGNLVNFTTPAPILFESVWDQEAFKIRLVTGGWSGQAANDATDALKFSLFR